MTDMTPESAPPTNNDDSPVTAASDLPGEVLAEALRAFESGKAGVAGTYEGFGAYAAAQLRARGLLPEVIAAQVSRGAPAEGSY